MARQRFPNEPEERFSLWWDDQVKFFFLTHPEPLPPSQPDGSGSSLNKTFQPTFWKSAGSCAAFLFQSRLELLSQHLGRSCKTYTMRGLLVFISLACLANAQHQALIDYLERRLLAIEVSFFMQSPALSPDSP